MVDAATGSGKSTLVPLCLAQQCLEDPPETAWPDGTEMCKDVWTQGMSPGEDGYVWKMLQMGDLFQLASKI